MLPAPWQLIGTTASPEVGFPKYYWTEMGKQTGARQFGLGIIDMDNINQHSNSFTCGRAGLNGVAQPGIFPWDPLSLDPG